MSPAQMQASHVAHYTATSLRPPHYPFTRSDVQTVYTADVDDLAPPVLRHQASPLAPPSPLAAPSPVAAVTSPSFGAPVYAVSASPVNAAFSPADLVVAAPADSSELSLTRSVSPLRALPSPSPASPVPGTHYIPPLCEYVPPHKLQPGIQPSYSPYKVPVFVERPVFDLGRPTKHKPSPVKHKPSLSTSTSTSSSPRHHEMRVAQRSLGSSAPSPTETRTRGGTASRLYIESEPVGAEPSLDWDYRKPRRRACC
eukprot:Gregarina_sp_Pseudo_9__5257@NODE_59_length_4716_cov_32_223220_g55_i0_p3_GENE_NODE_59_length_4716_cov_32_223220_g55_i0NODE_59_length_4716_cov_32_223220_g55_i0_p3_ORF_typecomplete_len255_score96_09AAA_lid_2/PF17863_1/0_13_NODE_59_length_4716_cov_32_223220_g55_i072836